MKRGLLLLGVALFPGCVSQETIRQPEAVATAPGRKQITERTQSLMLERDSIRLSVTLLPVESGLREDLSVRQMTKKDFEPILKDGYVNYAEEENADLLSLYNIYKELQWDRIHDWWGNRMIPDQGFSWLLDRRGEPRFSVFNVVVENKKGEKIRLQPSSIVLVTDVGDQVSTFSKETLIDDQREFLAGDPYEPHPAEHAFWREHRRRFRRVLDRAVFSSTTVFPGARVEGLVFFPRLERDVSSFSFIVPDVTWESGDHKSVDFEIEFSAR